MSNPNETAVVPAERSGPNDALDQYTSSGAVANPDEQVVGVTAWVNYVWYKTQNDALKDTIKANGGTLPTFALTRAGYVQPLKPLKFHLFDIKTIWTENDDSGKIIGAEPSKPQGSREELKRWAEHSFAVIAVVDGDTLVPATISLRSGSRKALTHAATATRDAKDAEKWAKRGEKFARTVKDTPFFPGRVISVGSVQPQKSPTTGRDMLVGQCSWTPSSPDELARFNAAMASPQFRADLVAVANAHAWKLKQLLGGGRQEFDDEADGATE